MDRLPVWTVEKQQRRVTLIAVCEMQHRRMYKCGWFATSCSYVPLVTASVNEPEAMRDGVTGSRLKIATMNSWQG